MQKIFLIIGIMFVSFSIYARAPKPEKCPDVTAIIATPLQYKIDQGTWIAYQKSKYDTNDEWLFELEIHQGTSEQDAEQKAKEGIKTLKFDNKLIQRDGHWTCFYHTDSFDALFATARTPA